MGQEGETGELCPEFHSRKAGGGACPLPRSVSTLPSFVLLIDHPGPGPESGCRLLLHSGCLHRTHPCLFQQPQVQAAQQPLRPLLGYRTPKAPPSTQAPPPTPQGTQVHTKSQKLLLETNELQQSDTQCTLPKGRGGRRYRWAPGASPSPGRMTAGASLLGLRPFGLECAGPGLTQYKIQK